MASVRPSLFGALPRGVKICRLFPSIQLFRAPTVAVPRSVGRVGGVGVCKHQVVQLAYRLFPAMVLAGSAKKNELIGIPDEKVWVKRPLRCLPLPAALAE